MSAFGNGTPAVSTWRVATKASVDDSLKVWPNPSDFEPAAGDDSEIPSLLRARLRDPATDAKLGRGIQIRWRWDRECTSLLWQAEYDADGHKVDVTLDAELKDGKVRVYENGRSDKRLIDSIDPLDATATELMLFIIREIQDDKTIRDDSASSQRSGTMLNEEQLTSLKDTQVAIQFRSLYPSFKSGKPREKTWPHPTRAGGSSGQSSAGDRLEELLRRSTLPSVSESQVQSGDEEEGH